MIIIGITGTLGAGKGTIVEYLVREYGFRHYSVRKYISEEIVSRNLSVNRDNMVIVANDLRASYGPAHIVTALYQQGVQDGKNTIIESIRTIGEVDSLKQNPNFYLLAVDADSKTRYQRILSRQSSTDNVSYKKFLDDERKEMQSGDHGKQNLAGCIQRADFIIGNNSDLNNLYTQVDIIMTKILNNV